MQKSVIVRYTTRADRADENQRLIEQVFAELNRVDPGGVRYASFRLADGVSFLHVATTETADGSNPLLEIKAFGEFTKDIAARCEEPPLPQDATIVGAYGFPSSGPPGAA
jgi:hypothetical protein